MISSKPQPVYSQGQNLYILKSDEFVKYFTHDKNKITDDRESFLVSLFLPFDMAYCHDHWQNSKVSRYRLQKAVKK